MIYLDTSILVRAFRMGLAPEGVTRSHSVAEFYSVLSGRGITVDFPDGRREQLVLSPQDTATAIQSTFANVTWCDLSPKEVLAEIPEASGENVLGPQIHDWMHLGAAAKSIASEVATLNERHWKLWAGSLRLVSVDKALKDAPKAKA